MKIKRSALSLAVLSALSGGVTYAQTASTDEQATAVLEEITVTGSNIRRDSSFENKQPVQIVGQADIARIGASQPVDLLKELTVNTGSRTNDNTGGANGPSQVNIRGLGFGSTLTLINGRRAGVAAISDTSGTDFVDINQFPLSAIKRIDVLTDGASAIYGSSAVAGVANIVTRKGFEGFEVTLDYRDANTDSLAVSFAAGHAFERGHFNVYGTYYEQENRFRSQIDFLDERLNGNGNPTVGGRLVSSTGSPGTYFRAFPNGDGTFRRPDGALRAANGFADPDCLAAGGIIREPIPTDGNFTGVTCRLNFFDQVSPIRAEERFQLFTEFDWEFSDKVKFIHENHWSFNLGTGHSAQNFIGTSSALTSNGGWLVPADHPFNFFINDPNNPNGLLYAGPEAFANNPNLQAVPVIAQMRPFGAIASGANFDSFQDLYGNQERRSEFNYFRMVNAIEIELGGKGNWLANLSHTVSANRYNDGFGNSYITDRLDDAIQNGSFNPFGTAITQPDLISPRDGVSTAFNEPTDVALFNSRRQDIGRTREDVIDLVVSGDLLETSFGTVSAAFGAQYRDLTYDFVPDTLLGAGEGSDNSRDFPFDGEQDVTAFFAEAIIPYNDLAELQIAVRHEDYGGNVGSTTDPKVSLKVQPNDWFTLRGSLGTSFQAPSVRQSARAVSTAFIDDTNCSGLSASITVTVEGSPELRPQSADSFTLGAVFDVGENAQVSVDAWSYDYEGVISQGQSAQAIVDAECADGVPNDPRVIRDAAGFINTITSSFENVQDVEASGVDIAGRYDIDGGSLGNFVLDSKVSYLSKMDITNNGVTIDAVGSRNFRNFVGPQPEIRANGSLSWFKDNHSANLTMRYTDSYENDQSNNAEIESFTTFDAQYTYTIDSLFGDNDTVFTLGVNNVFDEDPPALRRADSAGNIITSADNPSNFVDRPGYDDRSGINLLGRSLYLRVKQSF